MDPASLWQSDADQEWDLKDGEDPVNEWLDNLLEGHSYDHVGANTYAQGGESMSRTTSDAKTQERLFQDFDRTSSKESQKEVQPHPQRYRSWSINELMAVAGPTHQRGQVGVVPEGGVASVGGQQPDIYANQHQQHQHQQQQQQQQERAFNASGQNWMGGNHTDGHVQGFPNPAMHPHQGLSDGQWPENNLAQSRPRRNSLQRTGAPPIPPPTPSFPGNPYHGAADGGTGGVGAHSYPTRRRNSLRQDQNFQMQQQLQEFQRMHLQKQHQQHQHQHQQHQHQHQQWGQHHHHHHHQQQQQHQQKQQQQQELRYQYENVDLAGMYPGEHTPDQLGSFLTSGGGHFPLGAYQPEGYGMPQQNGQMIQGPGGVLGMAYYAASNFIRRAGDIASVVTGGRSRRGSLSGEVPAVLGQQSPAEGPSGQQQLWGQQQQQQQQPGLEKERLRDDAIEVASFLHEVQTASTTLNQIHAVRKPEPVAEVKGRQRRTMSGTVYPVPSPFEENSNVGIGNVFSERVADNGPHAAINLEQFFLRCPTGGAITCIKWAGQIKGVQKVKKGKPKEGSENQSKKFDHCCFISMTLEGGFSNVSVKVFCTGRLQTTGCKDGAMSLLACKHIADCLRQISMDVYHAQSAIISGPFGVEEGNAIAYEAPNNVRLEKESVLGVFDLGFREKGFSVDMNELRSLLNHPDNKDRIYKVNVPNSDEKKKVDRFQGIGVYVNREFIGSPNNVFVSIFPTGKCTVTAAPSVKQANQVAEVIGKLVVDLFVQCRKRDMDVPAPKRQRTKKKQ